jgi:hypothetical protein
MRIFEALFKVVSTRFGLLIVENSIENPHFIFCLSFQNLRLGSIKVLRKRALKSLFGLPKSSFGEHNFVQDDDNMTIVLASAV